jgi:ATP-dependent DNA ligase
MNINSLIETLAADNSRNFKIDYLRSNSDNELLKKVIVLALDPFVNFYIRKIPNYVSAQPNQADTLDSVLDSLEMLSSRKVTGNAGIEYLTKLLSSVTEDDGKVIERIIGKDLKCGVSVSTVNKVWKDLIQEFPCMLCSQYEQRLVDKIAYPAYVQRKEDGMRVCVIVRNGAVEFRTRNGKELDLLGNLQEEFIAISDGKDVVFDGELLIKDNGVIIDRKTGNGILMKSQRGTLSIKEASMVNVIVWDMIPYDKFIDEKDTTPYLDRFNSLCLIKMPEKISIVDTEVVSSLDEARSIFEDYLSKGFEGIILKDFKGIWENKRSKTQIKFKGELECDVKIVGIQEGTVGSKYEGMLGALVCESSDGVVKVSVGSGFTDDQRKELMKENLIGKIVAIKYNSRIVSKTGEHSIFLPIFIEIREDKDIADSSSNIK